MRKTSLFIITLLALISCNPNPDSVRITGDFANLEQGEFYIYSPSGAIDRLDTIKIQEGEFEYTARIDGEAIFAKSPPNAPRSQTAEKVTHPTGSLSSSA